MESHRNRHREKLVIGCGVDLQGRRPLQWQKVREGSVSVLKFSKNLRKWSEDLKMIIKKM